MGQVGIGIAGLSLLAPLVVFGQGHVVVALDMDAKTPGLQHTINVPPGAVRVADVGVYFFDPTGRARFDAIGYIGGIDRGIALGHTPNPRNVGIAAALHAGTVTPIDPSGVGFLWEEGGIQEAFEGPEVQYIEFATGNVPFPREPGRVPTFTVDVVLQGAVSGDNFEFFLLDFVTVWRDGRGGAFSTDGGFLNTGGDAVPDGTVSLAGIDADVPQPIPPATFTVDFQDGPGGGGGGTIVVGLCYADCDTTTGPRVLDVFDFLCFQNRYVHGAPYACDCDTSTGAGVCDVFDFLCFQNAFAAGCP